MDVSLNAVMHNENVCISNLRDDLNKLYNWSVKWKMCFNPDPTKPAENVIFINNKNSTYYDMVKFAGLNV